MAKINIITESLNIVTRDKNKLTHALKGLKKRYKTTQEQNRSMDIAVVKYAIHRFKETESRIKRLLEDYNIPF